MDEAMAGFPTLGAVTLVSGLLALEPREQAAMARPVQQSRTAMPGRARPPRAARPKVLVTLTICLIPFPPPRSHPLGPLPGAVVGVVVSRVCSWPNSFW